MDMTAGEQLAQWIEENLGAVVVERDQKNVAACQDFARFMEALRMGWLRHTGWQPLTRHVMNAIARTLPGGETRFARPTATRSLDSAVAAAQNIDALVAAAMVHAVAAGELGVADIPMAAYV